jgi:4-amino-4-deoxy-L-arabinose transferase-like glycosyltransferase
MKKTTTCSFLKALLLIAVIFPVYLNLGEENLNVDQLLWYKRTSLFSEGLKTGNFSLTYQQYHPGVTLMYLIMFGQNLFSIVTHMDATFTNLSYLVFPLYNFYTKFFVTTFCFALNILSAFFLSKITKKKTLYIGFLVFLLTEPFYIGLLRNLHMDAIAASLIFASVISYYVGIQKRDTKYFILSGVLSGFGLLTKSITGTAILLNFFVGIIYSFSDKNFWILKRTSLMFVVSFLVFYCFFPAMWVSPLQTLNNVFIKGVVGVGLKGEDNFSHFVNGVETSNPGFGFYLLVFKYRLSLAIQFLLFIYISLKIAPILYNRFRHKIKISVISSDPMLIFTAFSLLYVVGYTLVFSMLTKKTDRYIASVIPFLCFISAYTFDFLYRVRKTKKSLFLLFSFTVLAVIFNAITLFRIHPYYFAYYNPVWGGLREAKNEIYINQGGIGAIEIARYLNSIEMTSLDKVGASNFEELRWFSKYPILSLEFSKRKEYKFEVIPLQKDQILKKDMNQIYTLRVLEDTYWRIYTR